MLLYLEKEGSRHSKNCSFQLQFLSSFSVQLNQFSMKYFSLIYFSGHVSWWDTKWIISLSASENKHKTLFFIPSCIIISLCPIVGYTYTSICCNRAAKFMLSCCSVITEGKKSWLRKRHLQAFPWIAVK